MSESAKKDVILSRKMKQETEYGEPWGRGDIERDAICLAGSGGYVLFRPKASNMPLSDENIDRILACVNALAGCPDPLEFMDRIRKAYIHDDGCGVFIHKKCNCFFSWLKAVPK